MYTVNVNSVSPYLRYYEHEFMFCQEEDGAG